MDQIRADELHAAVRVLMRDASDEYQKRFRATFRAHSHKILDFPCKPSKNSSDRENVQKTIDDVCSNTNDRHNDGSARIAAELARSALRVSDALEINEQLALELVAFVALKEQIPSHAYFRDQQGDLEVLACRLYYYHRRLLLQCIREILSARTMASHEPARVQCFVESINSVLEAKGSKQLSVVLMDAVSTLIEELESLSTDASTNVKSRHNSLIQSETGGNAELDLPTRIRTFRYEATAGDLQLLAQSIFWLYDGTSIALTVEKQSVVGGELSMLIKLVHQCSAKLWESDRHDDSSPLFGCVVSLLMALLTSVEYRAGKFPHPEEMAVTPDLDPYERVRLTPSLALRIMKNERLSDHFREMFGDSQGQMVWKMRGVRGVVCLAAGLFYYSVLRPAELEDAAAAALGFTEQSILAVEAPVVGEASALLALDTLSQQEAQFRESALLNLPRQTQQLFERAFEHEGIKFLTRMVSSNAFATSVCLPTWTVGLHDSIAELVHFEEFRSERPLVYRTQTMYERQLKRKKEQGYSATVKRFDFLETVLELQTQLLRAQPALAAQYLRANDALAESLDTALANNLADANPSIEALRDVEAPVSSTAIIYTEQISYLARIISHQVAASSILTLGKVLDFLAAIANGPFTGTGEHCAAIIYSLLLKNESSEQHRDSTLTSAVVWARGALGHSSTREHCSPALQIQSMITTFNNVAKKLDPTHQLIVAQRHRDRLLQMGASPAEIADATDRITAIQNRSTSVLYQLEGSEALVIHGMLRVLKALARHSAVRATMMTTSFTGGASDEVLRSEESRKDENQRDQANVLVSSLFSLLRSSISVPMKGAVMSTLALLAQHRPSSASIWNELDSCGLVSCYRYRRDTHNNDASSFLDPTPSQAGHAHRQVQFVKGALIAEQQIESSACNHASSIGFCVLLRSLLQEQNVMSKRNGLGQADRVAGLHPYIDFVVDNILLPAKSEKFGVGVGAVIGKWKVIAHALGVIIDVIRQYDIVVSAAMANDVTNNNEESRTGDPRYDFVSPITSSMAIVTHSAPQFRGENWSERERSQHRVYSPAYYLIRRILGGGRLFEFLIGILKIDGAVVLEQHRLDSLRAPWMTNDNLQDITRSEQQSKWEILDKLAGIQTVEDTVQNEKTHVAAEEEAMKQSSFAVHHSTCGGECGAGSGATGDVDYCTMGLDDPVWWHERCVSLVLAMFEILSHKDADFVAAVRAQANTSESSVSIVGDSRQYSQAVMSGNHTDGLPIHISQLLQQTQCLPVIARFVGYPAFFDPRIGLLAARLLYRVTAAPDAVKVSHAKFAEQLVAAGKLKVNEVSSFDEFDARMSSFSEDGKRWRSHSSGRGVHPAKKIRQVHGVFGPVSSENIETTLGLVLEDDGALEEEDMLNAALCERMQVPLHSSAQVFQCSSDNLPDSSIMQAQSVDLSLQNIISESKTSSASTFLHLHTVGDANFDVAWLAGAGTHSGNMCTLPDFGTIDFGFGLEMFRCDERTLTGFIQSKYDVAGKLSKFCSGSVLSFSDVSIAIHQADTAARCSAALATAYARETLLQTIRILVDNAASKSSSLGSKAKTAGAQQKGSRGTITLVKRLLRLEQKDELHSYLPIMQENSKRASQFDFVRYGPLGYIVSLLDDPELCLRRPATAEAAMSILLQLVNWNESAAVVVTFLGDWLRRKLRKFQRHTDLNFVKYFADIVFRCPLLHGITADSDMDYAAAWCVHNVIEPKLANQNSHSLYSAAAQRYAAKRRYLAMALEGFANEVFAANAGHSSITTSPQLLALYEDLFQSTSVIGDASNLGQRHIDRVQSTTLCGVLVRMLQQLPLEEDRLSKSAAGSDNVQIVGLISQYGTLVQQGEIEGNSLEAGAHKMPIYDVSVLSKLAALSVSAPDGLEAQQTFIVQVLDAARSLNDTHLLAHSAYELIHAWRSALVIILQGFTQFVASRTKLASQVLQDNDAADSKLSHTALALLRLVLDTCRARADEIVSPMREEMASLLMYLSRVVSDNAKVCINSSSHCASFRLLRLMSPDDAFYMVSGICEILSGTGVFAHNANQDGHSRSLVSSTRPLGYSSSFLHENSIVPSGNYQRDRQNQMAALPTGIMVRTRGKLYTCLLYLLEASFGFGSRFSLRFGRRIDTKKQQDGQMNRMSDDSFTWESPFTSEADEFDYALSLEVMESDAVFGQASNAGLNSSLTVASVTHPEFGSFESFHNEPTLTSLRDAAVRIAGRAYDAIDSARELLIDQLLNDISANVESIWRTTAARLLHFLIHPRLDPRGLNRACLMTRERLRNLVATIQYLNSVEISLENHRMESMNSSYASTSQLTPDSVSTSAESVAVAEALDAVLMLMIRICEDGNNVEILSEAGLPEAIINLECFGSMTQDAVSIDDGLVSSSESAQIAESMYPRLGTIFRLITTIANSVRGNPRITEELHEFCRHHQSLLSALLHAPAVTSPSIATLKLATMTMELLTAIMQRRQPSSSEANTRNFDRNMQMHTHVVTLLRKYAAQPRAAPYAYDDPPPILTSADIDSGENMVGKSVMSLAVSQPRRDMLNQQHEQQAMDAAIIRARSLVYQSGGIGIWSSETTAELARQFGEAWWYVVRPITVAEQRLAQRKLRFSSFGGLIQNQYAQTMITCTESMISRVIQYQNALCVMQTDTTGPNRSPFDVDIRVKVPLYSPARTVSINPGHQQRLSVEVLTRTVRYLGVAVLRCQRSLAQLDIIAEIIRQEDQAGMIRALWGSGQAEISQQSISGSSMRSITNLVTEGVPVVILPSDYVQETLEGTAGSESFSQSKLYNGNMSFEDFRAILQTTLRRSQLRLLQSVGTLSVALEQSVWLWYLHSAYTDPEQPDVMLMRPSIEYVNWVENEILNGIDDISPFTTAIFRSIRKLTTG